MTDEDEYPTAAQQRAFSHTHGVIKKLLEEDGYDPIHVGHGVLIAAISCFSKRLSYEEIAEFLYQYADENAIRERLHEGPASDP